MVSSRIQMKQQQNTSVEEEGMRLKAQIICIKSPDTSNANLQA